MVEQQKGNVNINVVQPYIGLNMSSTAQQVKQGELTWAVNAVIENFNGEEVTYQNEEANKFCQNLPAGYRVIGSRNIIEKGFIVFWLFNPDTEDSEIGRVFSDSCEYETVINDPCLGFDINYPILKTAVNISDCITEVYWTDGKNGRRFIDFENLPYKTVAGCPPTESTEIDCNKLLVQPNFTIPQLDIVAVDTDGDLEAGTYQFAIQYATVDSEAYTSYYSVTNPLSIFDPNKITLDFNYRVGKSIDVQITNLDTTGYYTYFNLAVIKTVNNIPSVELVGTYQITSDTRTISYTGQNKAAIRLTPEDIFEKFPFYDVAQDLTTIQDVLVWDQLTSDEQISYQKIANQITLQWQTHRLRGDKPYAKELNTANTKGYMRDEVYAPELVLLITGGKQTDGFHIPGRVAISTDLEPVFNSDVVGETPDECDPEGTALPRWKVYNTGSILGTIGVDDDCYEGPYQYGEFGYYESTETYPCNPEVYGELSDQPIRYPRFPDSLITHIHDNQGFIYPIGFRIDVNQIVALIANSDLTPTQKARIVGFKIVRGNRATNKSIKAKGLIHNVGKYEKDEQTYFFPNYLYNDLRPDPFISSVPTGDDSGTNDGTRLEAFITDDSRKRYTLHSPDTSFYQPFLGNILKLETAEHGVTKGHFVQVKDHAKYKFLSRGSYALAVAFGVALGVASNALVIGNAFNGAAAIAGFNTYLSIIENLTPWRNFAYQHTSVGDYTSFVPIQNDGNKQRFADIAAYISPGTVSAGDIHQINNYQRESSVYIRTNQNLPFASERPGVPEDQSKWILSMISGYCDNPSNILERNISSYYASIKTFIPNQYGTLYSYETIDTGFQMLFSEHDPNNPYHTVFGGDVFINKFAYKSKFPFFLDNRVGTHIANGSDVEYDKLSNVAYTIFWMSTDVEEEGGGGGNLGGLFDVFGVKVNNFDCKENKFFYQKGKFYLFAYGIPYFYCESEVNVDMRGAFNAKEGDFYPRVGEGIPDDWLQEVNTTIQQDNTYHYNKTYSKQNKENLFTHLPDDFVIDNCTTNFPFRAIYSDPGKWLTYRPVSYFDFPQNYGKLTSLDGIEDRVIIAKFENKSLIYNALLTAPTSAADVYLGQEIFSTKTPPLDFAETDSGYAGSQHKMFIRTEFGHIQGDSKRGQIFVIRGTQAEDITGKADKFLGEYLDFDIKRAFPEINIDNHFNGVGLHGVYDNKYKRFILTKLDYKPIEGVSHEGGKFFYQGEEVSLEDTDYFCNHSFTISYDLRRKVWVSMHTYLPNFYVWDSNSFYSGINEDDGASLWKHGEDIFKYNNFYGVIHPYTLEYPIAFSGKDEILHSIKDYTKVYQYTDFQSFIETDEYYYNECVIFNNQQSSGILKPKKKPSNNLSEYQKYPKYNTDSKEVLFTKSNNFYNINTFWALNKTPKSPMWKKSCQNLSIFKEVNQDNMDYSKRSFKKAPLVGKDLKIRLTLNDRDDIKMVSQFLLAESQISHK